MRILVTGPRGFVGARIMATLEGAVPAPSLRDADREGVRRLMDRIAPDLVIHTAAMSDIGACERDPEGSYRANVLLPVWIAETGVRAVMFSTDQVYGGCGGSGPYREEEAAPVNLYARHKLEMERRCLDIAPDTVLLRAAWMYDMPMYGIANRGNFLVNMLREKRLAFSSVQRRGITYVREAAGQIMGAAALPGGVYNYGSENDLTMLETARWLKDALDLDTVLSDAGPRHDLWMDCAGATRHGVRFSTSVGGLEKCIADYGLRRA